MTHRWMIRVKYSSSYCSAIIFFSSTWVYLSTCVFPGVYLCFSPFALLCIHLSAVRFNVSVCVLLCLLPHSRKQLSKYSCSSGLTEEGPPHIQGLTITLSDSHKDTHLDTPTLITNVQVFDARTVCIEETYTYVAVTLKD